MDAAIPFDARQKEHIHDPRYPLASEYVQARSQARPCGLPTFGSVLLLLMFGERIWGALSAVTGVSSLAFVFRAPLSLAP